jgi:tRNA-specific adenosine deaminase 1
MSESESSAPLPSRIASLVHAHFDALPTRSKPSIFPDGSREWIPMTGIVVVIGMFLVSLVFEMVPSVLIP